MRRPWKLAVQKDKTLLQLNDRTRTYCINNIESRNKKRYFLNAYEESADQVVNSTDQVNNSSIHAINEKLLLLTIYIGDRSFSWSTGADINFDITNVFHKCNCFSSVGCTEASNWNKKN